MYQAPALFLVLYRHIEGDFFLKIRGNDSDPIFKKGPEAARESTSSNTPTTGPEVLSLSCAMESDE